MSKVRSMLLAVVFAVLPLAFASAQTTPAPAPAEPTPAQTEPPAVAPAAPAAAPAAAQTAAAAQSAGGSFGAFSKNSSEPIDIESEVLVVHDQQKYATFKGDVKAVQGTTTLRSRELDVHYAGSGSDSLTGAAPKAAADAPSAAPGAAANQVASADPKPAAGAAFGEGGNQITKIEARGNVIITSDQDQTTTSDWALFDVPAQVVTVGGNVVLTQGKNVLKGDRLVIDLKTGESRFENTGTTTGGKIRALFMPKQDAAAKDGKSHNDQSGKDAPGAKKPAPAAAAADNASDAGADDASPGDAGTDDAGAQEAGAKDASAKDAGTSATAPQPLFPGMPQ